MTASLCPSSREVSLAQRQANSVDSGSKSASAWHRLANWEAKLCCDHVVLGVGI
jgi:hypothetical protein